MGSFLKRQKRIAEKEKINASARKIKKIKRILNRLDDVARGIVKDGVPLTKANVEVYGAYYMGRGLDEMEQNIVLSKVTQVYEKLGIKPKEKSEENNKT